VSIHILRGGLIQKY